MVIIITRPTDDGGEKVEAIYATDVNIIEVENDNIPNPEIIRGKRAEMRINQKTKEIYYVYIDLPLSDTEELLLEKLKNAEKENLELREKQELMQKAIDDMILGGAK